MKSWTIVEFVQSATVEAVPSSWIIGEYCHWPSLPMGRLMKAVKGCDQVNENWPKHAVKHFMNSTYDTYAQARAKAKVAEETSDLQSDVDLGRLRKRKAPEIMSDTDSDQESEPLLFPPPALTRRSEIGSSSRMLTQSESDQVLYTPPPGNYGVDTSSRVAAPVEIEKGKSNQVLPNSVTIGDGQANNILKALLEQQHLLRALLTDVSTRVANIEKMLTKGNAILPQEEIVSIFSVISCPVSTFEEFENLEKFLREGDNAKHVACELAKIGGVSCANFVKRTLGTILADKLAVEFSWLGKKGKRRFEATQLAKIIVDAAKTSSVSTTESETEINIQKWLRRAPERAKHITKDF